MTMFKFDKNELSFKIENSLKHLDISSEMTELLKNTIVECFNDNYSFSSLARLDEQKRRAIGKSVEVVFLDRLFDKIDFIKKQEIIQSITYGYFFHF